MGTPPVCRPRELPKKRWQSAARLATQTNPANAPDVDRLVGAIDGFLPTPDYIAAVTTKYWQTGHVRLTVQFLDEAGDDLEKRILSHMNAWSQTADVTFVETAADGNVRIAFRGGDQGGYWSYVGTDILSVGDPDEPTMNLEGFSMETPEEEFHRVVRHEAGHTLGFAHEHMRADLVKRIDRAKAVEYFARTQGWSAAEVQAQVLTPLEERMLISTAVDQTSIMCYQLPGEIMEDGVPVLGGKDLDACDLAFAGKLYPKRAAEPETGAVKVPVRNGGIIYILPGTDPALVAAVLAALGA
jgi:hypothetical protein